MRVSLEWLNVTVAELRQPSTIDCGDFVLAASTEACRVDYTPAIVAPIWV